MSRRTSSAGLAAAALLLAAGGLVGCGNGGSNVDQADYVEANQRIFDKLPRFRGSAVIEEVSTPYRDGEAGPVSGYGTRFVFVLPEGAKGAEVSAFYERRLRQNWQVVERLDGRF